MNLPETLPGHWHTADGLEKAREYATKARADLAMPDATDLGLANALFLVSGEIAIQTAAKERMRWLSVQLALRDLQLAEAVRLLNEARALAADAIGAIPFVAPLDPATPLAGLPLDTLLSAWETNAPDLDPEEGWNLFESDTYGWEIEADSDSERFCQQGISDDDGARAHVRAQAEAGVALHQLALAIHLTQEALNQAAARACGYTIRGGYQPDLGAGLVWGYVRPGEQSVTYCGRSETAAWSGAFRDLGERSDD